jgi:hypothetical protein
VHLPARTGGRLAMAAAGHGRPDISAIWRCHDKSHASAPALCKQRRLEMSTIDADPRGSGSIRGRTYAYGSVATRVG